MACYVICASCASNIMFDGNYNIVVLGPDRKPTARAYNMIDLNICTTAHLYWYYNIYVIIGYRL